MKYSDWQLKRLRDSLHAYHHYERSHDGEYFTWKDVSEAIDEYVGVNVPPERLRQFVEGVNTKDGGRKFPVPQDKSLEGIASFVTVEELCLISEDELKEFMPEKQAALRLLEYLDQKVDAERIVPAEKIQGLYFAIDSGEKEDQFIRRDLTLQRPTEDGLLQVVETEERFDRKASSKRGTKVRPNSCIKHGGWAILTPEDNLLFFLKNEIHGRNRYYFTMASDLVHWEERPITRLVLLRHDFPVELEETDVKDKEKAPPDLSSSAITQMLNNVLVFERSTGQHIDGGNSGG